MRFTDSPEITLPVGNSVLSFQQDNSTLHVGTSVWPCSLVLVKFAERWSHLNPSPNNPYSSLLDFRQKRAIEIGAGCGVAAMGFYLLGLHDVVVTDIPAVMPALKHNLKRNRGVLGKSLKTACLNWGTAEQIRAMKPPFDVVIAADVVYIEESVGPLVGAMAELMGDHGVVLLGYQVRSPEADLLFWEMCGRVFEVQKVPHEHLHTDYAYEEADVYILRKKS